jgi:hypothetical protein
MFKSLPDTKPIEDGSKEHPYSVNPYIAKNVDMDKHPDGIFHVKYESWSPMGRFTIYIQEECK